MRLSFFPSPLGVKRFGTKAVSWTNTWVFAVVVQPIESVPVTIYSVVVAGVASGLGIVLLLRPCGGFHCHWLTLPVASSCTEFPFITWKPSPITFTSGSLILMKKSFL